MFGVTERDILIFTIMGWNWNMMKTGMVCLVRGGWRETMPIHNRFDWEIFAGLLEYLHC